MKISISEEIRSICPGIGLGILYYTMEVKGSEGPVREAFDRTAALLAQRYQVSDIVKNPHIRETREAYKALGKAPSTYRNSAEAMLRRIAQGKGLYYINNAIEINNLFSVKTGYSLGTYDLDRIEGEVELRRSPEGEHYRGIGKEAVNIGCLPVLYDAQGAFGNPTSDSRRAMITDGVRRIMTVIYSFAPREELERAVEEYRALLQELGGVEAVTTEILQ